MSLKHCSRDTNKVAHIIARHAFESNSNFCWDDDPPNFIMPTVISDEQSHLFNKEPHDIPFKKS